MATEYEKILTRLVDDPTPLKMKFPTELDMIRFKFAIFQAKKNFDEIMLMMDPGYEISSLQYQIQAGTEFIVHMFLFKKSDRSIKYQFIP